MASAKRHYIPGDIWHAPVKYVKGNISSKTTWWLKNHFYVHMIEGVFTSKIL